MSFFDLEVLKGEPTKSKGIMPPIQNFQKHMLLGCNHSQMIQKTRWATGKKLKMLQIFMCYHFNGMLNLGNCAK